MEKARIRPFLKIPNPKTPSDYRPISVVPVLSRITERIVVHNFLYPSLTDLPPDLDLINQYACRLTGSTTAALIAILQSITTLLKTNPYVFCFSFDHSKAFDTLSYAAVATKLSKISIPDNIYNWNISYLHPRSHVTSIDNITSTSLATSPGIVQ